MVRFFILVVLGFCVVISHITLKLRDHVLPKVIISVVEVGLKLHLLDLEPLQSTNSLYMSYIDATLSIFKEQAAFLKQKPRRDASLSV